jgi:hypothetical protein
MLYPFFEWSCHNCYLRHQMKLKDTTLIIFLKENEWNTNTRSSWRLPDGHRPPSPWPRHKRTCKLKMHLKNEITGPTTKKMFAFLLRMALPDSVPSKLQRSDWVSNWAYEVLVWISSQLLDRKSWKSKQTDRSSSERWNLEPHQSFIYVQNRTFCATAKWNKQIVFFASSLPHEGRGQAQAHEPYLQTPPTLTLCALPPTTSLSICSSPPSRRAGSLRGGPSLLRPTVVQLLLHQTDAGRSSSTGPSLGRSSIRWSSRTPTGPFLMLAGDAGSRTSYTRATRSEEVKSYFPYFLLLRNSQKKWRCSALYEISD